MSDKKTTITKEDIALPEEMTAADLNCILALVTEAYSEAGRQIILATVDYGDDDLEIIIDNRDPTELN